MKNRKIRVLLVEDDEDDYLITRELLADIKNRQFLLEWVKDYEAALVAIAQGHHDIYLLDYRLSNRNGLELLQEMRSRQIDTPVIFITGQGAYAVDIEVMNAGAADYLVKGRIDAEQLERSIRYALERSRTLTQLRQSEERYRTIVEDQTELICRFLPDQGQITFVNQAYCRYFQTCDTPVIGQSFFQSIPPAERTQFITHLRNLTPENPVFKIEFHSLSADGNPQTLFWTNRAIFDKNRRIIEYQSVGQDISPRKQLEEALQQANAALGMAVEERTTQLDDAIARLQQEMITHKQTAESLRQSEAKNRMILNALPDLLFRVAADGTFLDYLPTSNFSFLLPPKEFLGKPLKEVLPLEVADKAMQLIQQSLATGQLQVFDYQLQDHYGETQDYQARIVVSGESEVLVLVSDISDRKRAERALADSENRFRTSIETMLDCFGIYSAVRDEAGQIIDFLVEYVNAAACENNRLTKAEQIGKSLCEILPAQRETKLFSEYCELVETGKPLVKESFFYQEKVHEQVRQSYLDIRAVKLGDGFAVAWRNVTDRKQGENALKKALKELKFQKFALDQAALVSMTDSTGMITYANEKFCQTFQYSRTEFIGQSHRVLNSGYHSKQFFKDLWEKISRGEVWHGEIKNRKKDNSFIWVDITIVPFVDESKKPFQYLAINFDITQRKQAEEVIRESEERYRILAEKMPQFIWLTNSSSELEYCNHYWSEYTGLSLEKSREDGWINVIYPDDIPKLLEAWHHGIQTGNTYGVEYRVKRQSDGTYRWFFAYISALRNSDQEIVRWIGAATDIDDRKRAEESLRESEERFRQLTENIHQVFWMISRDYTQILYVSPAYEKIWGDSCQSLYDQPTSWLESVHPEDRDRVETAFLHQNITSETALDLEYRIIRTDGAIRWIWARTFAILNQSQEAYRFAGIAEDITERKLAEGEIINALAKEKELSELKSRFVAMTSHEFRTPLTTIQSAAELLEHYGSRWTEADKIEQLQYIQSAVQHMTHLLDDVLVIGNAEGGNLEFNPMPLDLVRLCHRLVSELKLTKLKQHAIAFIKPNQTYPANLDQKLLRLILGNLLSNAAKYSAPGSTIQFELSYQETEAIFQIQDQGIGISELDQQHLFNFFYRASNVGTIPGTGLGLAIVKKCVDLQGGQIKIVSQLGVGTTVSVALPLQPRES